MQNTTATLHKFLCCLQSTTPPYELIAINRSTPDSPDAPGVI